MVLTLAELARKIQDGSLSEAEHKALRRDPRAGAQRLWTRLQAQEAAAAAETARLAHLLQFERALWQKGMEWVAGVDEAGAGPLAGPVHAAAVILAPGTSIDGVDDSKNLTAEQREALAERIRAVAVSWAVASCSSTEVDSLNVLQASREAMRRAVLALHVQPEHLLVDARHVPRVPMGQTALVKGDSRSQSIAAASILAKVTRDAEMTALAAQFPGYGFEQHRGYGTAAHLEALARLGPCPIHRLTFGPVAALARSAG